MFGLLPHPLSKTKVADMLVSNVLIVLLTLWFFCITTLFGSTEGVQQNGVS